ncbi:hypothetical protein Y032_0483g2302 [Ancylostoma ceylanicum]|uniref:Uncharacterized protein n=1 Tax=Ancylostoma ceylanicum TaxID=53326 RepID=A0A016WVL6_9BILA|nr:hypothetical protein Y032_0483g2302 [Ancylostoma ceylanicum]
MQNGCKVKGSVPINRSLTNFGQFCFYMKFPSTSGLTSTSGHARFTCDSTWQQDVFKERLGGRLKMRCEIYFKVLKRSKRHIGQRKRLGAKIKRSYAWKRRI